MYKKLTAGLLLLCMTALPGLSYTAAHADTPANAAGKPTVIATEAADVTGDGVKDSITLVGTSPDDNSAFQNSISLRIFDASTNKMIEADLKDFGGYEPKIFLGDFTGDKVKDIMISAPTGGSGGIIDNRIVTVKDGKAQLIFGEDDNAGLALSGKFADGFKANLKVEQLNKDFTVDLSAFKDGYVEGGTYDASGKLKVDVEPWADGFSLLEPVEYTGDGTYYLRGIQSISGVAHVNRISNMESLWKYSDGKWVPCNVTYSTSLVAQ